MWAMWPLGLLYINTESRYGSLNCTGSFEETHLVLILKYQHLWRTDPVHIFQNSLIYSTWALSFFPFFFFFLLKYFDKRSLHRFRSSRFLCMTDTVELFLFEGVIVFGYIQNFPGSTCTGSTCTSFVGIKQVRDNFV